MESENKGSLFDESEIRQSSIEGIHRDEQIDLVETHKIIKKIQCEIQGTINQTPDNILNQIEFGGDGEINDFHLDHF